MIAACGTDDFGEIFEVVNDAARAYRGVIPADCWKDPYMPEAELGDEIAAGVHFWGYRSSERLEGVMGLQRVADVALIRHAYTRSGAQGRGIGAALLEHLKARADRPLLVGTWKAAGWAIRFYEKRGFALVPEAEKRELLRRYWTVPERQIEPSVVLRN